MQQGTYEIVQVGVSGRYRVLVKGGDGSILAQSQYRELKPMCLNEIRWMQTAGAKESLYERIDGEAGYSFKLHATDAHVLCESGLFDTPAERDRCIEELRSIASEARILDLTPQDEPGRRIHDLLQEHARSVVADKEACAF